MAKQEQVLENSTAEQIAKLQARISELEGRAPSMPNQSLTEELAKLKKIHTKKSGIGIPIRSIDDHTNVFLYTGVNHRVGALHPNNAIETMLRWAEGGVQLYTTPRTPEQVAAFKETKVWKDFIEKNRRERERMKKKDTAEELSKFAEIIAKGMGRRPEEMINVVAERPVK